MRLITFTLTLVFALLCQTANAQQTLKPWFALKDKVIRADISPDGSKVLLLKRYKEEQLQVEMLDVASGKRRVLLDTQNFTKFKSDIGKLTWIDNDHVAIEYSEDKGGLEELLSDDNVAHLLIVAIKSKLTIKSVRTKGYLVDPLPQEAGVFLYAKPGLYSKIYKLDVKKLAKFGKRLNKLQRIDGGQFVKSREIATIEGLATNWFLDNQGKVIAVLHRTYDTEQKTWDVLLSVFEKQQFTKLKRWELATLKKRDGNSAQYVPYEITNNTDEFYAFSTLESEKNNVYRVNYRNNTQILVYQSNAFKLLGITTSDDSKELTGVRVIKDGRIQHEFIAAKEKVGLKDTPYQAYDFQRQVALSHDASRELYYIEHFNQPGQFVLKQKGSNKTWLVGGAISALNDKIDSRQILGKLKVDELDIHYVLNLPAKTSTPPPLLVTPHGGPHGIFDDSYFDWTTQYLVSQGFAVLRVNFRGSGGYSDALKEAGKKQWGDGMLKDIMKATDQIIEQKHVDGNKVCALGFSYGGYAALMLAIKHPERFRCTVAMAAVTDVNLFLRKANVSKGTMEWTAEHIGSPAAEYEKLKAISPVYLAQELDVPLFLFHGGDDDRVDIEHGFRLKNMLDIYQKDYQWFYVEQQGHSMGDPEQRQNLFAKMIPFLRKYLD